jgi:hypothetical protein
MDEYRDEYDEMLADPIMEEVRGIKAAISAQYPTWEAYSAHLDAERPRLEAEGWKFASPDELPHRQQFNPS